MTDFSEMMKMMNSGKGKDFDDSDFNWSDDAKKRVSRVPQGFMRSMTISRIEDCARDNGSDTITLEIVESILSESRSIMGSMMGGTSNNADKDPEQTTKDRNELPESLQETDRINYYFCEMCGYTVKGFPPEECPICLSIKDKFILITDENKKLKLTATSGKVMRWEEDAIRRLEKIPAGFMRDMTKWRIESAARSRGHLTITDKVIEEKYEYWKEGSKKVEVNFPWEKEALERINRIPDFVRGMVQKEVERQAKTQGLEKVTATFLSKVRDKWDGGVEFHHD